jgi:branched-chain amino acid aminotransferase
MSQMSTPAPVCWVDGRLVGDQPSVRADDHGLTVGDGVFETAKIEDGRVFALTRHLARLGRSAAGLGLPAPDLALLREGIGAVLAARHLPFGRLRVTMTGGPGPLGSDRADVPPTYVVLASAVPRPEPSTSVVLVPWVRNERSAVAGLKTTSYAENVVALARARQHGASEALMANTRGELCEGTGTNVLLALDGRLVTPPLSSGALAGITRELLLEWAARDGLAIEERDLPVAALAGAQEVALLSSTRDVQPVHAVDGRALPAPGPLVAAAAELFARAAADLVDP